MTATATSFTAWRPIGVTTQLPPGVTVLLQGSDAQIGRGQLATLDASGNAALNDGTVPGLICAGVGDRDKLSDHNATAGIAATGLWCGFGVIPFSTGAGDGFTAADKGGVPAFIATENSIGRKSNVSGNNRSIAGVCFGLDDAGLAVLWAGPQAQAVARAMLALNAYPLGSFGIADAAASTAVAERAIRRPKVKGTIADVSFTGAAVTGDNTDYATVTIAKRGLADAYAAATTVATYDTRITGQSTITALTPTALVLSVVAGALFLLETDILTIVTTKGGSGKVLTGEFLVNGKAI